MTTEEKKQAVRDIAEWLGLSNSMVRCGEDHSERSLSTYERAREGADALMREFMAEQS